MGATYKFPGNGPWRILEDCLSPTHNSMHAAMGRKGSHKCICPRARFVLTSYRQAVKAKQTEAKRIRRSVARPHKGRSNGLDLAVLADAGAGNFRGAACVKERELFDKAFDDVRIAQEAKAVCYVCPIRESVCEPWIKKAEGRRPGSIHGVYAGATAYERKRGALRSA